MKRPSGKESGRGKEGNQMAKRKILTFDYGATSGRAILGEYENGKLTCTEIHRFDNNPVEVTGHLYWDILRLFHECKQGLIKAAIAGHRDVEAVGIDTWGVDFALLDENGMMLANPFAYRDRLTDGELERVAEKMPLREIYDRTGIQLIKFNTLFQLTAIREQFPELLARTKKLVFIPDLLNYFLTGELSSEFSIASTSSMLSAETHDWDAGLLEKLGLDPAILPPVTPSGKKPVRWARRPSSPQRRRLRLSSIWPWRAGKTRTCWKASRAS